ncbi:sensor histidine kinase [Paraburkholderia adhaesiva]|uniref:sensor histidine kinase n=1 Tax=Paraburkholderia adhaesiva TaxID=2883244 RepID=UPI001F30E28F|nr:ATP-binding protein [Paraburkholderia adhaesiva]
MTHAVEESVIPARVREDSDVAGQIALLQRQIAMAQAARIDADEAARQHLAHELHDSVGAELAATHFALARVHASLPADASSQCTEALALVAQSLNAAVEAVRHVLDGLSAPHLDAGLVPVLADWARGFGVRTGLATSFVFAADMRLARLSADAALAVFRVAQEALANVARHAHAARADVRLDCAPHHLILTITDDGIGLPRGGSRTGRASGGRKHYGLAGMRERCTAFGGTLRAGGRGAQAGTAVRARFAWDALLGASASDRAPSLVKGAH